MPKWLAFVRVFDLLAVALIAFLGYRLLIAPRFLQERTPAPRVTYATLGGVPYALWARRGHVVFLDFWATWCQPCRVSLPLVEAYARSHPEVDVVPVDVGEPRALVSAFARQHQMIGVALDPHALSLGFFQLRGFPTMVVIDPKGRIRATWAGLNPAIALNMAHAERALAVPAN